MNAFGLARAVAALGPAFDERVLAATRAIYAPHLTVPGELTVQRDLAYGPHPRHRLDLYRCGEAVDLPVVLFVHGGGFVAGDKQVAPPFYANVGTYFAAHGYLAASMNYRLAPDHAWPAGSEDIADAVDWLAAHAHQHGGDVRRLHVLGQSAGACHAAGYLFHPRLRPRAAGQVRAAALMSGFYRASAPLSPGQEAYLGADAAQYADRSATSHADGVSVPVLLTLAQYDPPASAEQTLALATALTRAQGRCPPLAWLRGHNHVSTVMSLGSAQDDAGRLLLDFFQEDIHP